MSKKTPFTEIKVEIRRLLEEDLPRIAGINAVNEFRENFRRQGFRNNGITPWPDVKRRDPNSPWYGFRYKGERRTSISIVRDKKTGKMKRAPQQRKLNFSKTATQSKILIQSSDLMRSIRVAEATPSRVVIGSDLTYAVVHNEGGEIRVFGKARKRVPKRQFIGESRELMDELNEILMARIDQIVDRVTDNQDQYKNNRG